VTTVLCCSSPTDTSTDISNTDLTNQDDTLLHDTSHDTSTEDIFTDLSFPDTDDQTDEPYQAVELESLFAQHNTWRVVRWESFDQVQEGDLIATSWEEGHGAPLRFSFEEAGMLREYRGDIPSIENKGCLMAGSWESQNSQLTWRWNTTPTFCPGQEALREEDLVAAYDEVSNRLRLELLKAHWTMGVTGRKIRPYRVYLEPDPSFLGNTDCEAIPGPTPCELSCVLEESGSALVASHALSCAPPAEVKSCNSIIDDDTGNVLKQTCSRGCYEIDCQFSVNEEGTPSGGCEADPGNLTCTYPE